MAVKPNKRNYREPDGSFDHESYEDDMGTYADLAYDEAKDDRMMEQVEEEYDTTNK